jgi:hypothetical protein
MPDIRKLLAKELGKQTDLGFGALTLTRTTPGTRNPAALSAGTNPTSTDYTCTGRQGVKRSGYWQFWQNAQTGTTARASFVGFTILGGSLPDSVTPRAGDTITHGGTTYTIAADGVSNPDGLGAIWECMTRAPGG